MTSIRVVSPQQFSVVAVATEVDVDVGEAGVPAPDRNPALSCSSQLLPCPAASNSLFRQSRDFALNPLETSVASRTKIPERARKFRNTLIIPCSWRAGKPNETRGLRGREAQKPRSRKAGSVFVAGNPTYVAVTGENSLPQWNAK